MAEVMGCHFHKEGMKECGFCFAYILSLAVLVFWCREPPGKDPRPSVQQPTKNWILPTTMWVSLEWILFQLSLETRLQPPLTLWLQLVRKAEWTPWLQSPERFCGRWPPLAHVCNPDPQRLSVCCHYMLFFKKWNSRLKAINKIDGSIHHSILDEEMNN